MKRLELLDYGRFAAALSVIAFHYFFNGISNGKILSITHIPALVSFSKYGYLGVEFFFMISGYVIFFSANNKTAGQFLASRAVRLFPAFWMAVLLTTIVAQVWGSQKMSVSLPQFVLNLTMFPNMFGQPYVDGVYWTLQYEWNFYFAVFVVLAIGLQSKLKLIFLLWPAYIFLAHTTGTSGAPYAGGYYCYFAAGALFAMRKEQKSVISLCALLLCAYLCVSFSAGKADELSISKGINFSEKVIGSIVIFQFLLFLFLTSRIGSTISITGSRLAGGLTYPMYLIHAHFGYIIISKFANNENRITIYILTISAVFVISYLIHIFVEQRLSKVWAALFSQSFGAVGDSIQNRTSRLLRYAYNNSINRTR